MISQLYGLETLQNPQKVSGGLQHQMLRVASREAVWALKIVSRRAVATPELRAGLERAETLAEIAARAGIPSLWARRGQNGEFLQRAGEGWVLLYPWREGNTLPPSAASPVQCALMGGHLGALHALKVRFPGQDAPRAEAFGEGHFEAISERATSKNVAWGPAIRGNLAALIEANRSAMRAQIALQNDWQEKWVTGHLDFDQKNVLWQGQNPTILDWESAKVIHPALELMGAGLNWAGHSAGNADEAAFLAFLRGYRTKNAVSNADLGIACEAVLGKWLIWLELNMQRSLQPEIRGTDEETGCHDALFHALGATLKLQEDVPLYRDWIDSSEVNLQHLLDS